MVSAQAGRPWPEVIPRPSFPIRAETVPDGLAWLHEVKHNGYRLMVIVQWRMRSRTSEVIAGWPGLDRSPPQGHDDLANVVSGVAHVKAQHRRLFVSLVSPMGFEPMTYRLKAGRRSGAGPEVSGQISKLSQRFQHDLAEGEELYSNVLSQICAASLRYNSKRL